MSDSTESHRRAAAEHQAGRPIRAAVLTVSDSRTLETDTSGALIERLLRESAHEISARRVVPDDAAAIRDALEGWLADRDVQAVLTTGGTGISPRDTTIEIVRAALTAELDGFGELFRSISYEEIGAAAMLSRAVGGLVARSDDDGGDTFVFAMPGSPHAVETAMRKLILPELGHLIWQRRT